MFNLWIKIYRSKSWMIMLFFLMSSNFNKALEKIRSKSANTVEQGFAFEKISKIYYCNK